MFEESEINDIRTIKQFKGCTFSNFKKNDVKKQCINSIYNNKIEESCYWIGELICSGQFIDIWEIILLIMSKYIYLANPKLPIYINLRYNDFKNIISNGYVDNEIRLRNNIDIRKMFCEIICTLCMSNKKPLIQYMKHKNGFDLNNLTDYLLAPNIDYIKPYYLKNDPKELFIALNEFCYQLIEKKDIIYIIFWIDWIIDYQSLCKKKKHALLCERRTFIPVQEKMQMDPIWIVWDILLDSANKNKILYKIVHNILELFCICYNDSTKKKRKNMIYHAVYLLIEPVNYNIDIFKNKVLIEKIKEKSHHIYLQIKKNEVAPNTDYLFMNQNAKSNIEKSVEKIKKMNEILG